MKLKKYQLTQANQRTKPENRMVSSKTEEAIKLSEELRLTVADFRLMRDISVMSF